MALRVGYLRGTMQEFINHLSDMGLVLHSSVALTAPMESRLVKTADGGKYLYVGVSNDGLFGTWYSCKHGEGGYWLAKGQSLSAEEKAEYKRKGDALRKATEAAKLKEQAAVAQAASEQWAFCQTAMTHPYLERKGIQAHGVGIDGKDLLIPMRDSKDKIWGLQTITPDGSKWFPKGGRKNGTFYLFPGPDDVIYIAGGHATAASVHEATGAKVVNSFDDSNLIHVAKEMRWLYPEAKIVVAGDNDQWTFAHGKKPDGINSDSIPGDDPRWIDWRGRGLLRNSGMTYGPQAAAAVGGFFIFPDFPENDKDKNKDFNDMAKALGLDAVKNRIALAASAGMSQPSPGGTPLPQAVPASQAASGASLLIEGEASTTPDWYSTLIFKDAKGTLDPKSLHNAITLLHYAPEYAGIFKFNEFKSDTFICRCPPWIKDDSDFTVRRVENNDLTMLEAYLERNDSISPGETKISKAVEAVGLRNKFHPVRDYFAELEWDGTARLATWLKDYAKAVTEPEEYLSKIGTMWMVAGVARVFEPGCKYDHMLVLEGPQDAGKSMLLRTIGTFGRDIEECYYTDSITIDTIEERGSILKLQGNLIIEFPELSGMAKKDQDQLKRWITLQVDEVEVKHRQKTNVLPRQFILAGTYNPQQGEGWMNDPTGGRRFHPVMCGLTLNIAGLRSAREQLWAEAVHLYKQGYQLYISKDDPVYAMAQAAQAHRATGDIWMDAIREIVKQSSYWSTTEILEKLGVVLAKQGAQEKKRVNKVLSQLGWVYERRRVGGARQMVWCKPDTPEQIEIPMQQNEAEEVRW